MSYRPDIPSMAMLRAFDAFGKTLRVRRAAALLGVSHAIVSRHLRALEEWLGIMLIDRDAGELTAAGEEYHARISLALDEISLASTRMKRRESSRLTIWCVPGFAYLWLTSRLPAFSAIYPDIALDLRPTDSSPDLLRYQADADIRWVRDLDALPTAKGVCSAALARPRVYPVARPDAPWLEGRTIGQPADVMNLPLLQEEDGNDWLDWSSANQLEGAPGGIVARLWQAHMTLAAAADGQGVALSNPFLAADLLGSGRLVELGAGLTSFPPAHFGAYRFMARDENWDSGPVARFRRWLEKTIKSSERG